MTVALSDAQDALRSLKDVGVGVRDNYNSAFAQNDAIEGIPDPKFRLEGALGGVTEVISRQASSVITYAGAAIALFNDTTGASGSSATNLLPFLRQYMGDNSIEITSRGTVYSAPVDDGGNTGTQQLLVTSVDQNNQVVEYATIENMTFRCTGSASSVKAVGQELYQIIGTGRGAVSTYRGRGRGVRGGTNSIAGYESGLDSILKNSSFDSVFSGDGADKIPFWDIVSGQASIARDTTAANLARDRGTGTNQASLSITGNCKLRFDFRKHGISLNRFLPYLASIRYFCSNASSADIDIRVGSATGIYTVGVNSGANATAYTDLTVDPDTTNAWVNNFDTDGQPFFEIEVSNYQSAETIHIDDPIMMVARLIGGRYLYMLSGITPALEGETHSSQVDLDYGTGTVTLSGSSGSIDTITIDSVTELLGTAISYDTSLTITAALVAARINERTTYPNYKATSAVAVVTITPDIPETGTITVVSTSTTLGAADVNITGGSKGEIQDTLVRHFGFYLPHASSPTTGWGDT